MSLVRACGRALMFYKVVWRNVSGVVGSLILGLLYCKFTASVTMKKCDNRSIFDGY